MTEGNLLIACKAEDNFSIIWLIKKQTQKSKVNFIKAMRCWLLLSTQGSDKWNDIEIKSADYDNEPR